MDRSTYRHSRVNLLPCAIVCILGIVFLLVKAVEMNYAGILTLLIGVCLTGYHATAIRHRRLEVNSDGFQYFDWLGRLKHEANWDEVRSITYSHEVGDETGYVLVRSVLGSVDVLGLENLDKITSRIEVEIRAARQRRAR